MSRRKLCVLQLKLHELHALQSNLASIETKVFLGFSMVKIHFLHKVLKKWSSFRKK